MKKKVAFIISSGHSGSSLLSLILGSHPKCFSAGELKGLPNRYRKQVFIDCVNRNSEFWEDAFDQGGLKNLAIGLSGTRIHSYIPLKLESRIRDVVNKEDAYVNPYSYMLPKLDVDVIVDSSKAISWCEKRLRSPEFKRHRVEAYIIHLVRDGRAVINSYLRKYPHRDIRKMAYEWSQKQIGRQEFCKSFSSEKHIEVQYEALASRPQETVTEICRFLDLEFRSDMLQYWLHSHHDISGNEGAYSLIDKYKGIEKERSMGSGKKKYYDAADHALRILGVVKGEIRRIPQLVCFKAQDLCKDGVKGSHPEVLGLACPYNFGNTRFHLSCSFIGKG